MLQRSKRARPTKFFRVVTIDNSRVEQSTTLLIALSHKRTSPRPTLPRIFEHGPTLVRELLSGTRGKIKTLTIIFNFTIPPSAEARAMTNIQRRHGASWWAFTFLLLMAAGTTVAFAQDRRSQDRSQSNQRDSNNRQQQASRGTWRERASQSRRDSNRQSQRRPESQNRRSTPQPEQAPAARRDRRQTQRDRDDRPRPSTLGSINRENRRNEARPEARQQNDRDRNSRQLNWRERNRIEQGQRQRPSSNRREQAFQNYRRRGNHNRRHHRIGHQVRTLPRRHSHFISNNHSYYYGDGFFYRPNNLGFVVVGAPYGFRLSVLPWGYATFHLSTNRYHYVNDTYYRWYPETQDYAVVAEPEGATDALHQASIVAASPLYIYPTEGQNEEQRDQDRFECHLWAVEETGFDPSYSEPDKQANGNYSRAITACLEGRGYSVK